MSRITYVLSDGSERHVETGPGMSVMDAARRADIPGIEAECGGACSCATCHVIIDPAWIDRVGQPDDMEGDLLDGSAAGRSPTSRLSCQIQLSPELDGLVVTVPPQ